MSLQLYNTKTKSKEIFNTVDGSNNVRIYSCGPTVYNYQHIGNFSMYIITDLLRKYLEFSGYNVNHVINITDVGHLKVDDDNNYDLSAGEDKFEIASRNQNLDPWEISKKYTQIFIEDMKKLNIINPQESNGFMPKATDNIKEMQEIIKNLIKNGFAYVTEKENIYFDVSKLKNYGKLSGKKLEDLEAGAGGRIDVEELLKDKKNIFDFSLWITDESHIMKWEFSDVIKSGKKGYPGWHIECSAMSMRYLSDVFKDNDFSKFKTLDIHTGGEDHIFPHHEDEIAQSEGCTHTEFSNFWMHRKHVLIDGEKMSKSKNNFYTISDLENGKIENFHFDPLDFRMWVLSGHYRTQMNFTFDSLMQARKNRETIQNFYNAIKNYKTQQILSCENCVDIEYYFKNLKESLDDDLNTPKAISYIFELIKDVNKNIENLSNEKINDIKDFINNFDKIFSILKNENLEIPKEILVLAENRLNAKKNKDFTTADKVRMEIESLGFVIKDNKDGYEILKK